MGDCMVLIHVIFMILSFECNATNVVANGQYGDLAPRVSMSISHPGGGSGPPIGGIGRPEVNPRGSQRK